MCCSVRKGDPDGGGSLVPRLLTQNQQMLYAGMLLGTKLQCENDGVMTSQILPQMSIYQLVGWAIKPEVEHFILVLNLFLHSKINLAGL